jgi:hypothetical protein
MLLDRISGTNTTMITALPVAVSRIGTRIQFTKPQAV